MTPGQPDEPRSSQPGQRALGAMESAVRRARVNQGLQGLPTPPAGSGIAPRTPSSVPTGHLPPKAANDRDQRRSERRLTAAILVVAGLVVLSGIALAVSASRHSGRPSPTAAPTTRPLRPGRSTTTAATTSTTVSPGGPPQISSLSPDSGSAGQTVTVNGSNFLSSNGRIIAAFNGQPTATSCPSQEVCTVTVPPPSPGATSAQVTITTASGTSNAVTFSYK